MHMRRVQMWLTDSNFEALGALGTAEEVPGTTHIRSSASEVRLPNELRSRTVQREWLLVAAGGTGEQVIVVLDGTRDGLASASGARRRPALAPAGQAAAVAAGLPVHT